MSGSSILLDTNTVLYLLSGDQTLANFLEGKKLHISVITELELLGYKKLTQKDVKVIKSFLGELEIENISHAVKKHTIDLRKSTKLKLPDCIIAATSIALDIPLVSSDYDLKDIPGLDLIFYQK